jgi:hypothetical protein
MATIHYTENWQFQVDLPDGNKPKFSKLLDAIEFCNYMKIQYELKSRSTGETDYIHKSAPHPEGQGAHFSITSVSH